ncbi:MAG: ABC transporter permease [Myxococcota bacterium]
MHALRREFGKFVAVDDVSFHVEQGEIFGWLGANGAGKSTTIRMLIGVLQPTAGEAMVAGASIASAPREVKRRIGYMSQRFSLYPDLTVRQNLAFFGGAYGLRAPQIARRIDAVTEEVDLHGLLDTQTGELPGGTRQRVALGASLIHEPRIVFLDEPTAGVDPVSRRRFWDLIRRLAGEGVTVFVTTHHLDEAEQCARIGLMVDGRLVALDSPEGLARTWVPGEVYRVTGPGVHRAAEALRAARRPPGRAVRRRAPRARRRRAHGRRAARDPRRGAAGRDRAHPGHARGRVPGRRPARGGRMSAEQPALKPAGPVERFVRRVWAMARKEVAHVRRDPAMLYLAIGMPLLLILIFGFGVRFDADDLPVVVVDQDRTAASADLIDAWVASGDLRLVDVVTDVEEARRALRSNRSVAALIVPPHAGADLDRGDPVAVQLLADGTDGTIANMLLANAEAITQSIAASRSRKPPAVLPSVQTRYNPAGQSAMFMLPGTITYVLALVSVLLTGLAVAREWERGSMEQLFATSVGIPEIVFGKLLPYLALGALDVLLALALGAAVFQLPLRGSLWLVALGSLLFIVGMLGQGLFISIVTRSQMLATQLGTLSAMLPSLLLSGFMFPVQNLPLPLWLLSHLVPARYLVALLRAVLLKGAGFTDVWLDLLGLLAFAVVTVGASAARFQRRIV